MAQRLEDNMQELLRSLERLAVQRQLPLRQHRERRVLKPGGGPASGGSGPNRVFTGPVLLYSPVALPPPKDSSFAGSTGAGGADPQHPLVGLESPAAGQQTALAAGALPPSPGMRTYSYVQSDPYSRPLSAKDLMTAGAVERAPSRIGTATDYQHPSTSAHPYHATQPALQHNTFIHPRSSSSAAAGPGDATASQASLPFRQHSSRSSTPAAATAPAPMTPAAIAVERVSEAAGATTLQTHGVHMSSAQSGTAAAKEKFEATLLKSAESGGAGAVRAASARPPTALVRPLSGVRNPHYTPSRPATGSGGLNSPVGSACQPEGCRPGSVCATAEPSASPSAVDKQSPGAADQVATAAAATSIGAGMSATFLQSSGTGDCGNSSSSSSGAGSSGGSAAGAASYYRISSKPESRVSQPPCAAGDGVSAPTQAFKSLQLGKKITSSESKSAQRQKQDHPGLTLHGSSKLLSDGETEEEDDGTYGSASLSDRTPGDGEAFDDEDDGIDCLDDDDVEGSDDDDDDEQLASSGGVRSRATSASAAGRRRGPALQIRLKSVTLAGQQQYDAEEYRAPALGGGGQVQPALTKSLFSNVPPYLNFVTDNERVELLPWEFRRLLRWRMCSITPNIVKRTIERSGFRATKKHYDWLGCWGKHMKAAGFKSVREYQKLNHFPGSFQIGRKDRLWKNLLKMQVQFGKKEYGFFPQTYVLPSDIKQLQRAWEDCGSKQKWIVKPPASARGIGIKVISKWNQIPKRRPVIVQKYLCRPYLINESKFDLRIYVYVPSYDPLRIYVYEDGLVRFASSKYSHSMKSISNKYMHLTNFSVNKKNTEYQSNSDESVCQGHKWSLKSLWGYLEKKGVNTATLWRSIKDIIVKTIISSEAAVNSCIKANVRSRYSVHELFGFDILLDEELKPWVLEVNISPSLHSSSPLDVSIKGAMIKDLHNMAAFRVPDKNDVVPNPGADSYKTGPPSSPYCMDKRLYTSSLTPDEKAKHAYYCQRYHDESETGSITDLLTPDDLRILIESIDEDCHKGGFQRVFPTSSSRVYLKFFEVPRYYNLLLDQWCQQFNRSESKGVAIIEMGCIRGVHLQNPTYDPLYQWCPPTSRAANQMNALLLGASNGQLPAVRKKTTNVDSVIASASVVSRPPISPPRKPSVASS